MMVPIVVKMAHGLNVDPWPYIIAVTVAASTAFALPMGYQTHMMVYGPVAINSGISCAWAFR